MVNLMVSFVAGAAIGVALERFVFAKMQENGIQSQTDALRACFGEPMCTTKLTFLEVKEWITERKDKLVDDTKAAVVKVDENTLRSLGKSLNTKGVENHIVLTIMTDDKQILDSLLIKYEQLDLELENALAKGNGILVVKG